MTGWKTARATIAVLNMECCKRIKDGAERLQIEEILRRGRQAVGEVERKPGTERGRADAAADRRWACHLGNRVYSSHAMSIQFAEVCL